MLAVVWQVAGTVPVVVVESAGLVVGAELAEVVDDKGEILAVEPGAGVGEEGLEVVVAVGFGEASVGC